MKKKTIDLINNINNLLALYSEDEQRQALNYIINNTTIMVNVEELERLAFQRYQLGSKKLMLSYIFSQARKYHLNDKTIEKIKKRLEKRIEKHKEKELEELTPEFLEKLRLLA